MAAPAWPRAPQQLPLALRCPRCLQPWLGLVPSVPPCCRPVPKPCHVPPPPCPLGVPRVPQHSLLADDLGVGLHQVVGDVPARQVLQDVARAPSHLGGRGRTDGLGAGRTYGPGAWLAPAPSSAGVPGPAPLQAGGYLGRREPPGPLGAVGQHPASPRPAAPARGGRLSLRPVPTPQHFQQGWGGRGGGEAVGVGSWGARPRPGQPAPPGERDPRYQPGVSQGHGDLPPHCGDGGGGGPAAWHRLGGWGDAYLPPAAPSQPPRSRRHSRLPSILHALGAEARLGQERVQQPSRVGVPRGVVAAGRCGNEPVAAGDTGTGDVGGDRGMGHT